MNGAQFVKPRPASAITPGGKVLNQHIDLRYDRPDEFTAARLLRIIATGARQPTDSCRAGRKRTCARCSPDVRSNATAHLLGIAGLIDAVPKGLYKFALI